MHGVCLRELSVSDMLDVIHYMFESDALSSQSGEHAEAKERVRSMMYREMYDREYTYVASKSRGGAMPDLIADGEMSADDDGDIPVPVDPFAKTQVTKRFIPATVPSTNEIRPFGAALDSPLG